MAKYKQNELFPKADDKYLILARSVKFNDKPEYKTNLFDLINAYRIINEKQNKSTRNKKN